MLAHSHRGGKIQDSNSGQPSQPRKGFQPGRVRHAIMEVAEPMVESQSRHPGGGRRSHLGGTWGLVVGVRDGGTSSSEACRLGPRGEFRTIKGSWPRPPGPPPLSGFLDHRRAQLAVQTKRVAAQVDGGAQVQQVLNIECLRDFLTPPLLSVRFR